MAVKCVIGPDQCIPIVFTFTTNNEFHFLKQNYLFDTSLGLSGYKDVVSPVWEIPL